jgi:hypothetical protein
MECESIKLHNYTKMIILYYIIILSKVSVRVHGSDIIIKKAKEAKIKVTNKRQFKISHIIVT